MSIGVLRQPSFELGTMPDLLAAVALARVPEITGPTASAPLSRRGSTQAQGISPTADLLARAHNVSPRDELIDL